MKKLILLFALSVIGILGISGIAHADMATLFITPASSTLQAGAPFNIAVQVNPANNKVCVVKGTLSFNNLTCRNITIANGLVAQTAPSCSSPSFVIGIPKCTLTNQAIISVSAFGAKAGQAVLSATGIKVIGAGADVPFSLQQGTYNITAPAKRPPGQSTPTPTPSSTPITTNPVPSITSMSATNRNAGDQGFTLTITGTNFTPSSFVNFAGLVRTTTYVNPNQLTVDILAFDLATPGNFTVTVTNPAPGGGTSNAQILKVNAKNAPAPGQVLSSRNSIILVSIVIIAGILAVAIVLKLVMILMRKK